MADVQQGQGPAPEPEWAESDRAWFEGLTGRAQAGNELEHQQGLRMRQAVVTSDARAPHAAALQDVLHAGAAEEGLRRLLAALPPAEAAEVPWWSRWLGLSTSPSPRRWAMPAAGLAMAATLAAVLVVPGLLTEAIVYDPPPEWRGTTQPQVVKRAAADPRKAAETLASNLKAAGVTAKLFQRGKIFVVDVEVRPDQLDEVRPGLQAQSLPVQAGLTRVEYSRP